MDAAGSAFLRKINDVGVNERFPARESDMGNAEVGKFINRQQPPLLIDELPGSLLPDVAEAALAMHTLVMANSARRIEPLRNVLSMFLCFGFIESSLVGAPEQGHRSR